MITNNYIKITHNTKISLCVPFFDFAPIFSLEGQEMCVQVSSIIYKKAWNDKRNTLGTFINGLCDGYIMIAFNV